MRYPMTSDPWFARLAEIIPQEEFYYLAGPMSGRPGFNFPEFDRIAGMLRSSGFTISSPAEYEHEATRARITAARGDEDHDAVGPAWTSCLARDVAVVAHPRCRGVIVMNEWEESRGARLETYVCASLKKPLFKFTEYGGGFKLDPINRFEKLSTYGGTT
jgi:hypothetical protein